MLKKVLTANAAAIFVLWTMSFRYYLAHLVNDSLRAAGETTTVVYLLVIENAIILSFYVGIVFMLVGIGRDVSIRGILTFDMRKFEPGRNRLYKSGFVINRLAALFSLYALIGLWIIGKPTSWLLILVCIVDLAGSIFVTLNLTRWLKVYGNRGFLEPSLPD